MRQSSGQTAGAVGGSPSYGAGVPCSQANQEGHGVTVRAGLESYGAGADYF